MATSPEPVPAAMRASVERRIVTVLFADLVGFTPLSERLDAEEVAAVQDAYFAAVRETIERYGGVLEKFIGDAAMAVFGAPHGRDDDAERAVRAGLALIAAVEQLGARLGLEPGELQLRVGVNSGEVGSIFRPFRRGNHADASTGGAGLGLALAKQWAEMLGGTLSYRPADGGTGACFRLSLPTRG